MDDFFNKVRLLIESSNDDYDDDDDAEKQYILDELIDKYGEQFYKPKLDDDNKRNACVYEGRNVIWFGEKGRSVIIDVDEAEAMEGNIFYDDKMNYLVDLINEYPEKIELEPGYCAPYHIDIQVVHESFMYDEIDDLTTGDDDLDNYLKSEYPSEVFYTTNDYELDELFNKYKTMLAQGQTPIKSFLRIYANYCNLNDIETKSEENLEALSNFIKYEKALKLAYENGDGDLDSIKFQIRDGNHRVFSAKKAGESKVIITISENSSKYLEILKNRGYTIL